jgi:hypothetical protein
MKEYSPSEMIEVFRAIGFTVMELDPGDVVLCDLCNADHTTVSTEGGIMFGSYACCPECAPRIEAGAKTHGEEDHIGERCPKGMTFAQWVRGVLRGGRSAQGNMVS